MKDKNVKRKQQQQHQMQFFPINKALIPALVRCIVGLWNRSCLPRYSTFSLLQPFSPRSTSIILEISEAPLRTDVLSLWQGVSPPRTNKQRRRGAPLCCSLWTSWFTQLFLDTSSRAPAHAAPPPPLPFLAASYPSLLFWSLPDSCWTWSFCWITI